MKKFDHLELWAMLHDSESTDGSAQAETVLDEFALELADYCRDENDIAERTRTLQFAHGELLAILKRPDCETVLCAIIERAVALIDNELDIVKMEVEHQELFATQLSPEALAKWNGTIAQLLEIVIALSLTELIRKPSGCRMNFTEIATLFGKIFGVEFIDLHGRKSKLLMRKKNESPFLDSLLFLYRKEVEKMSL